MVGPQMRVAGHAPSPNDHTPSPTGDACGRQGPTRTRSSGWGPQRRRAGSGESVEGPTAHGNTACALCYRHCAGQRAPRPCSAPAHAARSAMDPHGREAAAGPRCDNSSPRKKGTEDRRRKAARQRSALKALRGPACATRTKGARARGAQRQGPTQTRSSGESLRRRQLAPKEAAKGPVAAHWILAVDLRRKHCAGQRALRARRAPTRAARSATDPHGREAAARLCDDGGWPRYGERRNRKAQPHACALQRRHCAGQRALRVSRAPALAAHSARDPHGREAVKVDRGSNSSPRRRALRGRRGRATR